MRLCLYLSISVPSPAPLFRASLSHDFLAAVTLFLSTLLLIQWKFCFSNFRLLSFLSFWMNYAKTRASIIQWFSCQYNKFDRKGQERMKLRARISVNLKAFELLNFPAAKSITNHRCFSPPFLPAQIFILSSFFASFPGFCFPAVSAASAAQIAICFTVPLHSILYPLHILVSQNEVPYFWEICFLLISGCFKSGFINAALILS